MPPTTTPKGYSLKFESLFRKRYLRNNKRGGLKHLRCFPECLPIGHHANGFCGHRVVVSTLSYDPIPKNSLLVARFSFADNRLPDEKAADIVLGTMVCANDIQRRIRCRNQPMHEFIKGVKAKEEVVDGGKTKSVFHVEPPSWHYGWRSSKHTKDMKHKMYVYLLIPAQEEDDDAPFICAASIESTEFKLSSSKRARDGQEPTKQHLVVTPGETLAAIRHNNKVNAKRPPRKRKPRKTKSKLTIKIKPPTKKPSSSPPKTLPRGQKRKRKASGDNVKPMIEHEHDGNDNDNNVVDDDDFMGFVYEDDSCLEMTPPSSVGSSSSSSSSSSDDDERQVDTTPLDDNDNDNDDLSLQDVFLLDFLGWPKSMDEFALGSGFNGSSDDGKLPSSSVGPISRTSSHSSNFLEGGDRYRDLNIASLDDPSLFFFG